MGNRELPQTARANRGTPVPVRRHLRRLFRRLCGSQDVCRRRRRGHGWECGRERRCVRLGVVAHLLDGAFFIFTALTLYILLKHVQKSVARAMVVLVALATGIICLNAVFQFEALRVATDNSYAAAFGIAGASALVLLLLDMQHHGTLIAQVFFGLWLAPLGYLAYKSEWFPKWLGVVLILAAVCYLVDLLVAFLAPALAATIHAVVGAPVPAVAEISMVFYLLIIGVKTIKPDQNLATPDELMLAGA